MLFTYIRSASRNFQRNFQASLINLIGLSLSLAVFIIIAEFISLEYSYDSFHKNGSQIYRLIHVDDNNYAESVAPGIPVLIKEQIKEVEFFCRIADSKNIGSGIIQTPGNESSFRETNFAYADGNFFSLFSFPLTAGNASGLNKPYTVAITSEIAKKYFDEEAPIGKHLILSNQFGTTEYIVTSVFDKSNLNTDLDYDLLFSLETLRNSANLNGNESWASIDGLQSQWISCFVQVNSLSDIDDLQSAMTVVQRKVNPDEHASAIQLQALTAMHLGKSADDLHPRYSSLKFVYVLTGVAFLLLAIALFNYINLTTANSLKRAKEIGARKINGATKGNVISQFLVESLLYSSISLLLACMVVTTLQESINVATGLNLPFSFLSQTKFGSLAIISFAGMCIIAGCVVGVSLSGFKPIATMRGLASRSEKGSFIRKSLIVFQFVVSVSLITFTLVLFQQSQFMLGKELGMDASKMFIVRGPEVGDYKADDLKKFENEMASYSFVEKISRSGNVPLEGFNFSTAGIRLTGSPSESDKVSYDILAIDHRFFETYGMTLVAGRTFTELECQPAWAEKKVVILNERSLQELGLQSPSDAAGRKILWNDRELEIVGVVRDYHHLPVQTLISPVIFVPSKSGNYFSFKIGGKKLSDVVQLFSDVYKKEFPGNPFEYYFLTEKEKMAYQKERNYTFLFAGVSFIAIFIALLGILGLMTFMIEQRTREVGIRRVLGGTISHIVKLFAKDFSTLIIISAAIALPISSYAIMQWIESFAYRVDVTWPIYLVGPCIAALLCGSIVIGKVYKRAATNAVTLLRQE